MQKIRIICKFVGHTCKICAKSELRKILDHTCKICEESELLCKFLGHACNTGAKSQTLFKSVCHLPFY